MSISSRLICPSELDLIYLPALTDSCLVTDGTSQSFPGIELVPTGTCSVCRAHSGTRYIRLYITRRPYLVKMASVWSLSWAATVLTRDSDSKLPKIMSSAGATEIFDIRLGETEFDILQDIKDGLRPEQGKEKTLPTLLLYDEAGLRLFENITYLQQYYLTNAEIEVLEKYADHIAERVKPGSVVVELGSG